MKRCVLCIQDREEVSLLQVVPAGWTGFNNYVEVCADCMASEQFKKMIKQKKIISKTAAPAAVAAASTE